MRARWVIAVAASALVVVYFILASDSSAPERSSSPAPIATDHSTDGDEPAAIPSTTTGEPAPLTPSAHSPALSEPAVAADGAFDVRVTAAGVPVEAAEIVLYWQGARDPNTSMWDWRRAGASRTGHDGTARLFARAGRYVIAVRHERFAAKRVEARRNAAEETTRVAVALEAGVDLVGDTVGESGGVAYVTVTVRALGNLPREEVIRLRSDASGAFTVKGLAPGTYDLEAHKEGEGRGRLRDVEVPAAERVKLVLSAPAFLSGRVRTASGDDAAGARVVAIGQRGQPSSVLTGAGGAFAIEVDAGLYELQASLGSDTGAATGRVRATTGKTVNGIDIRLGAAATIAGLVTAAASPVAGASIDVSPYGRNGDSGRGMSGEDGRFVITPLAPGAYDVVVRAPGFTELSRRGITVVAGERFESTFDMARPGRIEGFVHDELKQPIANALIESRGGETRSNDAGRFVIADVTPGEHVFVSARRDGERARAQDSVEVRPGETSQVDLQLVTAAKLIVQVVGEDGRPPQSGVLVLEGEGRSLTDRRSLDGREEYELSLPWGLYRARVDPTPRANISGKAGPVKLQPGDTTRIKLQVSDGGGTLIHALVLDVDGSPALGARCSLEAVEGSSRRAPPQFVDREGRCILRVAPQDGPTRVYATADGGRASEGASPADQITLRLLPPGSLDVTVSGLSDAETAHVTVNARGHFESREIAGSHVFLRDLPQDEDVLVSVETSTGRRGRAHVAIEANHTSSVSIAISERGD